jgi:D-inositol-3-phosphate glycosyltransferase
LKTIHPGVDHDVFSPGPQAAARSRVGLGDELVLLYVGRIQPLKGLELALRSVEQLVPALDRPLSLVVVGGPSGTTGSEELHRLKDLARDLGIEENVRFVGPKAHSALPDFYRSADALVMCSHSESFGLAALEAQACGLAVVATATGGLAHIVGEGISGFLVASRDPSVFAARLKTLLSDSALRASFREQAVLRAHTFSWVTTADALLELYECLSKRQPELCTC